MPSRGASSVPLAWTATEVPGTTDVASTETFGSPNYARRQLGGEGLPVPSTKYCSVFPPGDPARHFWGFQPGLSTPYVSRTKYGSGSSWRHFMKRDAMLPIEHPLHPPLVLEQQQRMSLRIEEQHPSAIARDALDLVHRADHPSRMAG